MGWGAIAAALLSVFGPILLDWLKKLFSKAAKDLPPPESHATPEAAVGALFDAAVAKLPKRAYARRTALRVLRRLAEPRAAAVFEAARNGTAVAPLTESEVAEARDAAHAAK